jgi:L-aspartate oxidase
MHTIREQSSEWLDLSDIRNSLTALMWRSAGVRRQPDSLRTAASSIDNWCRYVLPRQFEEPSGWELQNMLLVSRLIVQAALEREESRGVHLRTDFPEMDNQNWQRHVTWRRQE